MVQPLWHFIIIVPFSILILPIIVSTLGTTCGTAGINADKQYGMRRFFALHIIS